MLMTCCCSVEQRVQLLREGLSERVDSVKDNAVLLLQIWFRESCNQDVTLLLGHIDVKQHPG